MRGEKSTRQAFIEMTSEPLWWKGLVVDGKPVKASTAMSLKHRFFGKGKYPVSVELVEKYLLAGGWKIVQEKTWIK